MCLDKKDMRVRGIVEALRFASEIGVYGAEAVLNRYKIKDLESQEELVVRPSRFLHYHVLARVKETNELIVAIEEGYTSTHQFNWHISRIVRARRIVEEREEYERVSKTPGHRSYRIVLKRCDVTKRYEDVPLTTLEGEVTIYEKISLCGRQERAEVRPLLTSK